MMAMAPLSLAPSRPFVARGLAARPSEVGEFRPLRPGQRLEEEAGLVIFYQPIVTAEGRIIGFEALCRCRRGPCAEMPLGRFIAAVEVSGQSGELTHGVLRALCHQVIAWRMAGKHPVRLSMNVCATDMKPGFADSILSAILEHSLDANWLTLEVTETQPFGCARAARGEIEQLRRHGVRIAIDDFGTGYSSMQRLLDIPCDEVKLDRSLVAGLVGDGKGEAIVESVVTLIHQLGMTIVAEGIEGAEQIERLAALGVREFQGFHFGKPRPGAWWSAML